MPGIKNSWSFFGFAQSHGKPKLTKAKEYVNKETGEAFTARSVAFVNDATGNVCFAGFSRKIGDMSAAEIAKSVDSLQVVEMENGNFVVCNKGENTWEDIDIAL